MHFSPLCSTDVRVLRRAAGEEALRGLLGGQTHRLLILVPHPLWAGLRLTPLFSALQKDGHTLSLITDIPSNPTVKHLASSLANLIGEGDKPTCILAIGGGSCIDLAKGISALWSPAKVEGSLEDSIRTAIHAKKYQDYPFIDIVAMPTTAGTGSEVTHWATLWDTHEKLSVDCTACSPKAAILIPEWTVGMPPALTLSTGLDALCHAMEAFWAKATNPLSQTLALSAVERVRQVLPLTLSNPFDVDSRQEMCMASLLAGLAFSQTRTTACHSLSYPLTLQYGLPHGFAAAVTLPSVLRRNRTIVPEISRLEALFPLDGGFETWLRQTCGGIQSLRLSAFGIREGGLLHIAEAAFTKGRMDNNPVLFSTEECLRILRECL